MVPKNILKNERGTTKRCPRKRKNDSKGKADQNEKKSKKLGPGWHAPVQRDKETTSEDEAPEGEEGKQKKKESKKKSIPPLQPEARAGRAQRAHRE